MLLASLQQSGERGGERLKRLDRILSSLSPDVRETQRSAVSACGAGLQALAEQLQQHQLAVAELGVRATLAVNDEPGAMSDVRKHLEQQQQALSTWERAVAAQMEAIAALQAPSARKSLSHPVK